MGQQGCIHFGMVAGRSGIAKVKAANESSVHGDGGHGNGFDEVFIALGEELVEGFEITVSENRFSSFDGQFGKGGSVDLVQAFTENCLLYTSPSPRD